MLYEKYIPVYSIKNDGFPFANQRVIAWNDSKKNNNELVIWSEDEKHFISEGDWIEPTEFTNYIYIDNLTEK